MIIEISDLFLYIIPISKPTNSDCVNIVNVKGDLYEIYKYFYCCPSTELLIHGCNCLLVSAVRQRATQMSAAAISFHIPQIRDIQITYF
jgi:hypothetical protein